MFPNLEAEMGRKGLKRKDLVPLFKGRSATVSDKLNGKTPLLLDEANVIKTAFFPNCSLDYLFEKECDQPNTAGPDSSVRMEDEFACLK